MILASDLRRVDFLLLLPNDNRRLYRECRRLFDDDDERFLENMELESIETRFEC